MYRDETKKRTIEEDLDHIARLAKESGFSPEEVKRTYLEDMKRLKEKWKVELREKSQYRDDNNELRCLNCDSLVPESDQRVCEKCGSVFYE